MEKELPSKMHRQNTQIEGYMGMCLYSLGILQVEVVSKQRQVQAIAMLATTLRWQTEVGEEAIVAPLQDILARCGQTLTYNFEAFLNETVSFALLDINSEKSMCLKDALRVDSASPEVQLHCPQRAGREYKHYV